MVSVQTKEIEKVIQPETLSSDGHSDSESGSIGNMQFGRLTNIKKPIARAIYSIKSICAGIEEPKDILNAVWTSGYNTFESSAQNMNEQKILGQWMIDCNIAREDIVLIVNGEVIGDLEASCERLQVAKIDMFILSSLPAESVATTVQKMTQKIQEGKMDAYGLSKWTTSMIAEALSVAQAHNLAAPSCDLVHHSLAESNQQMFASTNVMSEDKKTQFYPKNLNMAVIATGVLAAGFLAGDLNSGSVHFRESHNNGAYFKAENYAKRARCALLAEKRGVLPSQIAIAYVVCQQYHSFVCVSSNSIEHTRMNAAATQIKLTPSELRFLEAGTAPKVESIKLITPAEMMEEQPLSAKAAMTVFQGREEIAKILSGEDDRLIAITGPCSIHDPEAAIEYARELKKYADEHKDTLCVVMRVYFEKPRTTVGWKGLTTDPDLNGSNNMNKGLRLCRQILMQINEMGLPCAVELLSNMTPPYLSDLVSWAAIGARTTESQLHREMVSSLSEIPVGFKNGTQGNVDIALDAIQSAMGAHSFLGVGPDGRAEIVNSPGNQLGHVVLRGGKDGPNFSSEHIKACVAAQEKKKIRKRVVVDCSHGNSNKDHRNQPKVAADIAEQMANGSMLIGGVMIESNLVEGNQKLDPGVTDVSTLKKGVSITDACVNLPVTAEMLTDLSQGVKRRRLH